MENVRCNACYAEKVNIIGIYQPSINEKYEIYECLNCNSRFTIRNFSNKHVHENLHDMDNSSYTFHEKIALAAKIEFDKRNIRYLKRMLSQIDKYKYIIKSVEEYRKHQNKPKNIKILEIGCSLGYLTSYFILLGYDITGVDISNVAIEKAKSYFGEDKFHYLDILNFDDLDKYDIIYHTGTIGCVDDPTLFTNQLISHLNKNGLLLFNSPDVSSLYHTNKLWVSTPPPDLITLFEEKYWLDYYSDTVELSISYRPYDYLSALKYNYMNLFKVDTNGTDWKVINKPHNKGTEKAKSIMTHFWNKKHPIIKLEYGMYIRMKV